MKKTKTVLKWTSNSILGLDSLSNRSYFKSVLFKTKTNVRDVDETNEGTTRHHTHDAIECRLLLDGM